MMRRRVKWKLVNSNACFLSTGLQNPFRFDAAPNGMAVSSRSTHKLSHLQSLLNERTVANIKIETDTFNALERRHRSESIYRKASAQSPSLKQTMACSRPRQKPLVMAAVLQA